MRDLLTRQPLLLVAGLLALVVLIFVLQRDAPETLAPTPEAASVQPSADNVDPAFHARLMTLRQRVESAPRDTSALLELARLQQDGHQFTEAAATYERVLALAPEHRQARLDLALVYAESGRWAEARAATDALLARDPDDPAARYNLGAIAANQGDYDTAREAWTAVTGQTRDPDLAQQAAASLQQLEALASRGAAPPATPNAPAALAPVRERMSDEAASSQPVPPGHPPITLDDFEPVLAGE